MSLQTDRILLESKINGLKKDFDTQQLEAEMFITQIRNLASPYLELDEIEIDRIKLAVDRLEALLKNMDILIKDIRDLERKL